MHYAVLQPLPSAPLNTERETPAEVVAAWLGSSSGLSSAVQDAQGHLASKAYRLDAYVDPKEKERRLERKRPPKRFKLSRTELKKRGLLDITQDGLTYQDGLILNDLWGQYIQQILPSSQPTHVHHPQLVSSSSTLPLNRLPYLLNHCHTVAVSDFHGGRIRVVQAKNPSTVGIEGIIMQETESTFRVISEDNRLRTVLKADSIFHLTVPDPDRVFVLHGQHLCFRTAIRSKVKLKPKPTVQLR